MRTRFRTLPLISLVALAALLASATPGRATPEATIVVNTTNDEYNMPTGNGYCSLREAVRAANNNIAVDSCMAGTSGLDRIVLPEGFYQLSIANVPEIPDENNALTGDLDILGNLVIDGAGRDLTVIDGGDIDRVFQVVAGASVEIQRVTIQNGDSKTGLLGGGGILNLGTLTLSLVTLHDNRAVNVGGALDNLSTATLSDTFINGNYSTKDGGGIFNNGQLYLYSSTISGNNAANLGGGGGGGLDNRTSATLENITISGNTAPAGGGIFNDGNLFVLNSTFLENTAADLSGTKGGNIENADTVRIKNSIVANSLAGPNCAGSKPIVSEGNNIESADTCSFHDPSDLPPGTDPMVGPLADNGGPTLTHALMANSPAIDAGDDIDCPQRDQRRSYRPSDGNGDQFKVCDIGTYEYDGIFPSLYLAFVVR